MLHLQAATMPAAARYSECALEGLLESLLEVVSTIRHAQAIGFGACQQVHHVTIAICLEIVVPCSLIIAQRFGQLVLVFLDLCLCVVCSHCSRNGGVRQQQHVPGF